MITHFLYCGKRYPLEDFILWDFSVQVQRSVVLGGFCFSKMGIMNFIPLERTKAANKYQNHRSFMMSFAKSLQCCRRNQLTDKRGSDWGSEFSVNKKTAGRWSAENTTACLGGVAPCNRKSGSHGRSILPHFPSFFKGGMKNKKQKCGFMAPSWQYGMKGEKRDCMTMQRPPQGKVPKSF